MLRIAAARYAIAEHAGVELVFGKANARGQRVGRVPGRYGDGDLAEDFTRIELFGHQMDADAAMRIPCLDRAGVRIEPGVLGEQRRMDVEHASSVGRSRG